MKKLIAALCAALLLAGLLPAGLAEVPATPNQKLALRTGPNTAYTELYTLPQSTKITAFEYEEGNGVTWVLVEYTYQGQVCRGYTGLKRMSVHGSIPWAAHLNAEVCVTADCTVLAAPTTRAGYRGSLASGEWVTLLDWEDDYAYIEFYDYSAGRPSRGYVEGWLIDTGYEYDYGDDYGYDYDYDYDYGYKYGAAATPNQKLALRTGPNTAYTELYMLPQSTDITAYEYEEGNGVTWVLIEYFYQGHRCRGYTGLKRMSVHGDIPWANHYNTTVYTRYAATVYAAPAEDAGYRGRLAAGEAVTLLDYENGCAYVEYYDGGAGAWARGYVTLDAVE